jgi:hypothetical protein
VGWIVKHGDSDGAIAKAVGGSVPPVLRRVWTRP